LALGVPAGHHGAVVRQSAAAEAVVVVLAAAVTTVLSLNTTVVLLTPVVLALASRRGLPLAPFVFAVPWTANTGSLLLPAANLINPLAADRLALPPTGSPPGWPYRAGRDQRHPPVPARLVPRRPPLHLPAATVGHPDRPVAVPGRGGRRTAERPLLVTGLPAPLAGAGAAAPAVIVFAVRRPAALRRRLVPWRLPGSSRAELAI